MPGARRAGWTKRGRGPAGEVFIPPIRHTLGDIVFTRDDALIHVRLSHATIEGLVALARRIDARLKARSSSQPGT